MLVELKQLKCFQNFRICYLEKKDSNKADAILIANYHLNTIEK